MIATQAEFAEIRGGGGVVCLYKPQNTTPRCLGSMGGYMSIISDPLDFGEGSFDGRARLWGWRGGGVGRVDGRVGV